MLDHQEGLDVAKYFKHKYMNMATYAKIHSHYIYSREKGF